MSHTCTLYILLLFRSLLPVHLDVQQPQSAPAMRGHPLDQILIQSPIGDILARNKDQTGGLVSLGLGTCTVSAMRNACFVYVCKECPLHYFRSSCSLVRSVDMCESNPTRPPCDSSLMMPSRPRWRWFARGTLASSLKIAHMIQLLKTEVLCVPT